MTKPANGYDEVATITADDGVGVRITSRRSRQGVMKYSFSFFRTFPLRGGGEAETKWFSSRHIDAIATLIPDLEARLAKEAARDR